MPEQGGNAIVPQLFGSLSGNVIHLVIVLSLGCRLSRDWCEQLRNGLVLRVMQEKKGHLSSSALAWSRLASLLNFPSSRELIIHQLSS